jgi:hypothetical protein
MARFRHIALVAGLLAASVGLSACADGFDVDKLDVFGLSEKPKLPGERKPVFPEGVPGVSQGVPPELIKGNLPGETDMTQQTASAPAAAAAPAKPEQAAEEAPKPKPKAKAKPKPKVVRASSPPPQQQPAPQSTASQSSGTQAPWPSAQPQASGTNAPWPSSSPNSAPAPWPDAPAPGTFSR